MRGLLGNAYTAIVLININGGCMGRMQDELFQSHLNVYEQSPPTGDGGVRRAGAARSMLEMFEEGYEPPETIRLPLELVEQRHRLQHCELEEALEALVGGAAMGRHAELLTAKRAHVVNGTPTRH